MNEYQDPIRIAPDDPICSATAMNGTIVGILFEKTGSEIKNAINKRLEAVNTKIEEYQSSVSDVDKFLKKKEKDLEEIEKIYTERSDEKKAKMKPFERDIEDIRKLKTSASNSTGKRKRKYLKKLLASKKVFKKLKINLRMLTNCLKRKNLEIS